MLREYCFKHQSWRSAGEQCGQCAVEAATTHAYCEQHDLVVTDGLACPGCVAVQRRDTLNGLKAQVDDMRAEMDAELMQLRERVSQLERIVRLEQLS